MPICCGAIQLRNLKAVAHEAKRSVFQIDDVHMHVHAGESCMKRADSPDISFFFFSSSLLPRRGGSYSQNFLNAHLLKYFMHVETYHKISFELQVK